MGLDTEAAAIVMVQSDLPGAAGETQASAFEGGGAQAGGAVETYRSETPEEAEALLMARRLVLPALAAGWGDLLIDDVAVPRGAVG